MHLELLKKLYYEERKKLEEMEVYKQEARIKFIALKRNCFQAAESHLSTSEILGREDIAEEVKDNLLRDDNNEAKVRERLESLAQEDFSQLEKEEKEELRNAHYSAYDFAEYLYRLEKVTTLQIELENNRLFADAVYEELKENTKDKI